MKSSAGENNLLTLIGTVEVPATSELFNVGERFEGNYGPKVWARVGRVNVLFKAWFGSMTIRPSAGSKLVMHTINRDVDDREIISALGGEVNAVTTMADIVQLMKQQAHGGAGVLPVQGEANIFYVYGNDGLLRRVMVYWGSSFPWDVRQGCWNCLAVNLCHNRWLASSRRVFSRAPREVS
jgi:hypothetical protein